MCIKIWSPFLNPKLSPKQLGNKNIYLYDKFLHFLILLNYIRNKQYNIKYINSSKNKFTNF